MVFRARGKGLTRRKDGEGGQKTSHGCSHRAGLGRSVGEKPRIKKFLPQGGKLIYYREGRIEEAGRVQLVRCITRVGSCEIIPSSFRAGLNASRGEESRLNCSRHAARCAARCSLVEKG